MGYSNGTITSDANVTVSLVGHIETLLGADDAWEFVQEVVEGSYTSRVWRNLGSENGTGTNFYIALMRTSGSSQLFIKTFEDWNGTLAFRGCFNSTGTPEAVYKSRFGTTGYVLSNNNSGVILGANVSTASTTYFIRVTSRNLFCSIVSVATPTTIYAGLYEIPSFIASNSFDFPLICGSFGSTAGLGQISNLCFSSRYPWYTAGGNTSYWNVHLLPMLTSAYTGYLPSAPLNTFGDKIVAQPWYLVGNTSSTVTDGLFRGKLPNDILMMRIDAASHGDTITINGSPYVLSHYGGVSYASVWMKTGV